MANHYETSPPMFRNAPLKFILYLLLIPVFDLDLFLLLWWYIDNKKIAFDRRRFDEMARRHL